MHDAESLCSMEAVDVNDVIRPLLLKDLRVQCRARGISPAGSREALADRLKDHMLATNDLCAPGPRSLGYLSFADCASTGGLSLHLLLSKPLSVYLNASEKTRSYAAAN